MSLICDMLFGTKCAVCGKRTHDAVPEPTGDIPRAVPQTMVCRACSTRLRSEADERRRAEILSGPDPLRDSVEELKSLLAAGVNVNAVDKNGVTALIMASHQGKTEVVKLLLESGANVDATNKGGGTSLYGARANGHGDVVQLLEAAGAKK